MWDLLQQTWLSQGRADVYFSGASTTIVSSIWRYTKQQDESGVLRAGFK